MKEKNKFLSFRNIAVAVVVISVIAVSLYTYNLSKKEQIVNDAITQLNSIFINYDEKYIELEIVTENEEYNYQLQVYDENNNYYILESSAKDVDFLLESYCDNNIEYVKSNYTVGFELLNTSNCSNRISNIATGFAGFDFSSLKSNDFEIKQDGDSTELTAKKRSLSNNVFLGNFVDENEVEFSKFIITTAENSTSLSTKFIHPIYGEMTIDLSIELEKVLEIPEYK
ncbi:MAG: hypothetical protein ACK5K7_03835 [Bacilli bacterium]